MPPHQRVYLCMFLPRTHAQAIWAALDAAKRGPWGAGGGDGADAAGKKGGGGGAALLFTSHHLGEVAALADTVVVLEAVSGHPGGGAEVGSGERERGAFQRGRGCVGALGQRYFKRMASSELSLHIMCLRSCALMHLFPPPACRPQGRMRSRTPADLLRAAVGSGRKVLRVTTRPLPLLLPPGPAPAVATPPPLTAAAAAAAAALEPVAPGIADADANARADLAAGAEAGGQRQGPRTGLTRAALLCQLLTLLPADSGCRVLYSGITCTAIAIPAEPGAAPVAGGGGDSGSGGGNGGTHAVLPALQASVLPLLQELQASGHKALTAAASAAAATTWAASAADDSIDANMDAAASAPAGLATAASTAAAGAAAAALAAGVVPAAASTEAVAAAAAGADAGVDVAQRERQPLVVVRFCVGPPSLEDVLLLGADDWAAAGSSQDSAESGLASGDHAWGHRNAASGAGVAAVGGRPRGADGGLLGKIASALAALPALALAAVGGAITLVLSAASASGRLLLSAGATATSHLLRAAGVMAWRATAAASHGASVGAGFVALRALLPVLDAAISLASLAVEIAAFWSSAAWGVAGPMLTVLWDLLSFMAAVGWAAAFPWVAAAWALAEPLVCGVAVALGPLGAVTWGLVFAPALAAAGAAVAPVTAPLAVALRAALAPLGLHVRASALGPAAAALAEAVSPYWADVWQGLSGVLADLRASYSLHRSLVWGLQCARWAGARLLRRLRRGRGAAASGRGAAGAYAAVSAAEPRPHDETSALSCDGASAHGRTAKPASTTAPWEGSHEHGSDPHVKWPSSAPPGASAASAAAQLDALLRPLIAKHVLQWRRDWRAMARLVLLPVLAVAMCTAALRIKPASAGPPAPLNLGWLELQQPVPAAGVPTAWRQHAAATAAAAAGAAAAGSSVADKAASRAGAASATAAGRGVGAGVGSGTAQMAGVGQLAWGQRAVAAVAAAAAARQAAAQGGYANHTLAATVATVAVAVPGQAVTSASLPITMTDTAALYALGMTPLRPEWVADPADHASGQAGSLPPGPPSSVAMSRWVMRAAALAGQHPHSPDTSPAAAAAAAATAAAASTTAATAADAAGVALPPVGAEPTPPLQAAYVFGDTQLGPELSWTGWSALGWVLQQLLAPAGAGRSKAAVAAGAPPPADPLPTLRSFLRVGGNWGRRGKAGAEGHVGACSTCVGNRTAFTCWYEMR